MNFKLPKEYKKKWIEALESEKYEQDKGCLYNDCGFFCALGVALKAVSEIPLIHLENIGILDDVQYEYKEKIPSELTKDICFEGEFTNLADEIMHLNDSGNRSFKEIAIWIDNKVEEV